MGPATWYHRHAEALAGMLLLLVYVLALSSVPKQVFWHPDEGAKFVGMRTLRWDRGLAYSVPYPGRAMDPTFEFYPGHCRGGDIYPSPQLDGTVDFRWPIWFPLASRPFFDAFGLTGVYVLPLLGGWLSAVVAGRWMMLAGSRLAPLAILLIGCGTPVFFYSLCFFEHTLATFAAVVALSMLITPSVCGWRTALQMMPLLVAAVVLRIEMLPFAAAVAFSWAVSRTIERFRLGDASERAARVSWSSAVIVGAVVVVVLVLLGSLLGPRQLDALHALPDVVGRNLAKWPYLISATVRLLIGPLDLGPFSGWAWQLLLVLATAAAAVAPFVRSRRAEAVLILGALAVLTVPSLMIAFVSRPFLGRQGVLGVAPYMIVGTYVLVHAWRRRDSRLLRLACAATAYAAFGYLALFSVRVNEGGDELIGLDGCARYMLMLYPMGVVLSLVAIQTIRESPRSELVKSAVTIFVAAMCITSCVYELRALREMRSNKQVLVAWEAALGSGDRIVTDIWWLPAVLAPLSTTHEVYCVDEMTAFPEWLARARAHGARSFVFCTTHGGDWDAFRTGDPGLIRDAGHDVDGLHIYPFRFGR